jgi:hypothetical protein
MATPPFVADRRTSNFEGVVMLLCVFTVLLWKLQGWCSILLLHAVLVLDMVPLRSSTAAPLFLH